jgi:hypothetical protein
MVGGGPEEELRQLEQLTEDELRTFKLTDKQLILLRQILKTHYGTASFLQMLSTKPVFLGIHSEVLSKASGHHLIVDILTSAIIHSNLSYPDNASLRQEKKREWLNIILKYMQNNKEINVDIPDREATRSTLSDARKIIEKAMVNDEYKYDDSSVYEEILYTIEKQYDKL